MNRVRARVRTCQQAVRGKFYQFSLLAVAGSHDVLLIAGPLVLLLAVVVLTALFGDEDRRAAALKVLNGLLRWRG